MTYFQSLAFTFAFDVFPLVTGIMLWHYLDRAFKTLCVFYFIVVGMDVVFLYYGYHKLPNGWLLNIFANVEYAFWCYVFVQWITNDPVKKGVLLSIPLYSLSWLLLLGFEGTDGRAVCFYLSSFEELALLTISVYLLYAISDRNNDELLCHSGYLVCVGTTLYFAGTSIVGAIGHYRDVTSFWWINMVLSIFAILTYTGGMLLQSRLQIGGFSGWGLRLSLSWLLPLSLAWFALIAG